MTLEQAIDLHRAGKLPAAAEAYETLLQTEPYNHDAQYGLGTVRMQQGELESARSLLEQAVTAAPDIPEYRYNLGCVLQLSGAHFDAVEQFKLAYSGMPDSPAILSALARSQGGLHNYPAAIRAMEKALQAGTPQPADVLAYADLLLKAHEPDKARTQVAKARELGGDESLGYFIEARCARLEGDHDSEREHLQQAIALRPAYGNAWNQLLELTADDELLALADDCEGLANDLATPAREKSKLSYTVAQAYERLGDHEQAARHFAVANSRQREDAVARGKTYDRNAVDRFLAWAKDEFNGSGTMAPDLPGEEQPIFIVGMPRSGTTLVESILGGLDGVTTGGESEALELVSAQYYRALAQGQSQRVRELQPDHWAELAAAYWQIQLASKGRVTDKMPLNLRHVGLICRMFSSAPVIYVRRDPRDVAWSIYSRDFPDGYPWATDLEDIAHYYGVSLRLMEHFRALHPERILEIRYEELVDTPEEQTRQLAEFCGLQWRPECLDFHERTRASYTFSEMQVREPLNCKGIGRWRHYESFMAPFIDACVANGVALPED